MRARRVASMMLAALPVPVPAADPGLPSLEFLDFLGGLVEVEGELLGPGDMVEVLDGQPVPERDQPEQERGARETAASTDEAPGEGR